MVKFQASGSAGCLFTNRQPERSDDASPLTFQLRGPGHRRSWRATPFASLSLSADCLGHALGVISSSLTGSQVGSEALLSPTALSAPRAAPHASRVPHAQAHSTQQLELLPVGSKKGEAPAAPRPARSAGVHLRWL
jgi:hypothetical protein